jgi:hypothetical protein
MVRQSMNSAAMALVIGPSTFSSGCERRFP